MMFRESVIIIPGGCTNFVPLGRRMPMLTPQFRPIPSTPPKKTVTQCASPAPQKNYFTGEIFKREIF